MLEGSKEDLENVMTISRSTYYDHYFIDDFVPCLICRSILPIPRWVSGPNTIAWGCVGGNPILFNTVGIYCFYRLCNCVLVRWLSPRRNVILATKPAFQWMDAYFPDTWLHDIARARRVAFANWTSNWLSCFSQITWIIPKLLYHV